MLCDVAAETSRPLCECDSGLSSNMNALFALCVLCAYDPMDAWLHITQQQQQQLDTRLLTNHSIGITAAAVRVTRSIYNSTKVRASEHLDAGGRARGGSGGMQRAVAAAVAADPSCVCLQWGGEGQCSFGGGTIADVLPVVDAAALPVGDTIVFASMMHARCPQLARAWWDIIVAAYGPTPLLASHLSLFMHHCRSTAGLATAVQVAQRCLPTVQLVTCMHNLFVRHDAPCSQLR